MFTAQGFDGISMDQIAAEAGVSKLTVYSHFGDKETLFAAAVKSHCEQHLPTSLFDALPDMPLRERLLQIARAFFAMISAPDAVAGHRILCTPQMANSPLPQMFWEAGPKRVQDAFAELLRCARGQPANSTIDDDPARRPRSSSRLLKGEPHAQLVFGCASVASGRRSKRTWPRRRHVPARLCRARDSPAAVTVRAY